MEILTLPGPAGELWAAKREVLHSLPAETLARPIRPHLGGGTVLAARWGHRLSADVDVLLPGRETLIDLLWDDERNVVRRLGGEPVAVDDAPHGAIAAFAHGRIRLSTRRPDPRRGHGEALVDGKKEVVLSSAQVLREKLARPGRLLARDAFDVATAAAADPAALAAAAGMLSEEEAGALQAAWEEAGLALARDSADELAGVPARYRLHPGSLGAAASRALGGHRYRRLEIQLAGERLTIRKTVAAGPLSPERYSAADAEAALLRSGLTAHLDKNGPVAALQLLAAILDAADAGKPALTVFDSADTASARRVRQAREPRPGSVERPPAL